MAGSATFISPSFNPVAEKWPHSLQALGAGVEDMAHRHHHNLLSHLVVLSIIAPQVKRGMVLTGPHSYNILMVFNMLHTQAYDTYVAWDGLVLCPAAMVRPGKLHVMHMLPVGFSFLTQVVRECPAVHQPWKQQMWQENRHMPSIPNFTHSRTYDFQTAN